MRRSNTVSSFKVPTDAAQPIVQHLSMRTFALGCFQTCSLPCHEALNMGGCRSWALRPVSCLDMSPLCYSIPQKNVMMRSLECAVSS